MPRGLGAWTRRAAFEPTTLTPELVTGLALAAPVASGIAIFGLPALVMLAIALAAGGAGLALSLAIRQRGAGRPLTSAVVAVGLLGAASPLQWVALSAVAASALAVVATRYLGALRVQLGVVGATLAMLASRGAASTYLQPDSRVIASEPIRLWQQYFIALGQSPIDAVRLYVGNVPGPVFTTSLLAVVIGAAWLWYARRLSLVALVSFLAGALLPVLVMHWPIRYQLDSGPLWFVAALVLADRHNLPQSRIVRPVLGFVAGVIATAARTRGYAIEAAIAEVAALQLLVGLIEGAGWVGANRRRLWSRLHGASPVAIPEAPQRHYRTSSG